MSSFGLVEKNMEMSHIYSAVSTLFFSLKLFLYQQLRNEYDGISPDPGGTNRGFPGTSGPPRSEESCGNLQHISGNLEKTNCYRYKL